MMVFRASAHKAEYKENITGSADDLHDPEFQESDTDEISNRRRTPEAIKRTIKKVEIASRKCVPEIMIAFSTVSALSCTIALIAVLLDHLQ
ncbi:hypothetical protein GCK32_013542 [Trichostrongylus colubriformis]|uniref:Uncharacterized protein n=1 Tax=Trichostrongylus colubriformis TaxID=6319 RepID=A0AAN8FN76_TRICO